MTTEPGDSPPRRARASRVIRWVVRGALVAALVVLVALIVVRQTGTNSVAAPETPPATTDAPSGTPKPTKTPTPTPTPTPTTSAPAEPGSGGGTGGDDGGAPAAPANPAPVITSFTGTSSVNCPAPSEAPVPGQGQVEQPVLSFAWTGTGADSAFFGVQTRDAQANPFSSVGVNDSIALDFQCPQSGQIYTITLVGPGGATSQTIEVVNTGYSG